MKIQKINIILLITILSLLSLNNLKSEIPTIPIEYYFKTNKSGFPQMKTFNNKLFLLYRLPEKFWAGENNYSLDYYDNGKWNNLLDREDSLSIYDFDIDKSGNVWVVSGRGLFKYDWNKWEKFIIEDSLQNVRDFTNICIDSNDNIWCTTFCGVVADRSKSHVAYNSTYSEIYLFNENKKENKFELKKFREGGLTISRFGGINGIVCLPDGRVLIHDPYFEQNQKDSIADDLLIFDGSKETATTIQGPYYDLQSMPKFIEKIYPDNKGNIWFCSGGSGGSGEYDHGLIKLNSEGTWHTLGEENGFSFFSKFPDLDESYYLPTYAIHQDNNGNYWVGGDRFFGYLDNDLKLRIPNNSFYEKCTFITFDWMDTKQEDSTIKKHFYNLTHYDEVGIQEYWNGRIERITGSKNGDLWFGTSLGLLYYSPSTTNVDSQDIKDEQFAVYPNPILNNEKFINLVLYGNNEDFATAKLYSITGQIISESQVSFWGDLGKFPLPQNLTTGSYFIEIQSNNITYTEKIIIN